MDAGFERNVAELEKAGLAHGPAYLGAAILIRLDLLVDETKAVQKALEKLRK